MESLREARDGSSRLVKFVPQNLYIYSGNTFSGGDSIAFAVEKTTDLCQIAVPFDSVFNGSAFPMFGRLRNTDP